MRFHRVLATALLAAGAASADNISNELSVARTQETQGNPRPGNFADMLSASFGIAEAWTLNAGAMLTVESRTPSTDRASFGSSGGAVGLLTLGIDFDATEHFTLGLGLEVSPRSTQHAGTPIFFRANGQDFQGDALVKAVNSSGGLGLDLGYDTGGDSDLEWAFDGGITATRLTTTQSIVEVKGPLGFTATPQQALDRCIAVQSDPKKRCPASLVTMLQAAVQSTPAPQRLDTVRFSAAATATFKTDTDFVLGADYYGYIGDPAQFGSLARAGTSMGITSLAPLRYTVRPEVSHRFGDFSARLWVQGGQYVASAGGTTTGVGLKLQYKFTKAFKMWMTVTGQNDADDLGNVSKSGSVALGAGYRF